MYQIIDVKTGEKVGKPYTNRKAASHRANKLDLAYGAIRYAVRLIA